MASCTFNGAPSITLGPGTYSLAILGTALDGSTAACTSYVQVVDGEKPVVTCNATVAQCTGGEGATADHRPLSCSRQLRLHHLAVHHRSSPWARRQESARRP